MTASSKHSSGGKKDSTWTRHPEVAMMLRQQIVEGVFAPSSRLPTWDVLEDRFSVSRATIMRAIDRLRQDGFVRADGRRGMFVAERPPHLYRYALVFPTFPFDHYSPGWASGGHRMPRGWKILSEQAAQYARESNIEIVQYHASDDEINQPELEQLCEDIRSDRFAGVIFAASCLPSLYKPLKELLDRQAVPAVAILTENRTQRAQSFLPPMPQVALCHNALHAAAAQWLTEQKASRIAVIANVREQFAGFLDSLQAAGITIPRSRLIATGLEDLDRAANITELFLEFPRELRPDALVVMDENLLHSVTQVLINANVRVPEDMNVLAYVTWPVSDFMPKVSKCLGFHMGESLVKSIAMLNHQRQTGTLPANSLIGAYTGADAVGAPQLQS